PAALLRYIGEDREYSSHLAFVVVQRSCAYPNYSSCLVGPDDLDLFVTDRLPCRPDPFDRPFPRTVRAAIGMIARPALVIHPAAGCSEDLRGLRIGEEYLAARRVHDEHA